MKKIIYLFVIFLFVFSTQNVYACSPVAGFTYPSPESVLLQDNTAIGIYKISTDGSSVVGTLVIGNENSIMNMVFDLDGTSCGTRFNDFNKDEYVVSIFNKNDTKIHHTDLDSQFSYSFQSKSEAFLKFNKLSKLWSERVDSVNVDGRLYYSASAHALKPGMSNKEVLSLQNALKIKLGLGSDFKLDESYGPATILAVKQFQLSEGLDDDGIAGNLTQKKLETVILGEIENNDNSDGEVVVSNYQSVGYTLKLGIKESNDVKSLQSALKERLDLGDEFVIDGSYGPATILAVKQFQLSEGLDDDGIAGNLTQKALENKGQSVESNVTKNVDILNAEEVAEDSQEGLNSDIFDGEIKKILIRAKNEFINQSLLGQNYNEAYTLVVKYNNDLLAITDSSDPLYKSSGGGQYFVYFAKLSSGKYACVDNLVQKDLLEKDVKPDTTIDEVSC